MKRITIIVFVAMSLLIVALASALVMQSTREDVVLQSPQRTRQKGRERKIVTFQLSQIEQALELQGERAEQFRELYVEYCDAIKRQHKSPSRFKVEGLSNDQIDRQIRESYCDAKHSIEVKEVYYNRFRELLTPSEIAMMYEIERRTRERFLDEFKRRAKR